MSAVHPPLPTELQVEVTGACNLACKMCLVRYRPKLGKKSGAMCFHVFKELVDDGLERVEAHRPLAATELRPVPDEAHLAGEVARAGDLDLDLARERRRGGGVGHGHDGSSDGATRTSRISQPGGCRSAKSTVSATSSGRFRRSPLGGR